MRVLLLSPYPELIAGPMRAGGDDVVCHSGPPAVVDFTADMIVSFGYRHILKPAILSLIRRPILNIHISYLPWNRGADPNFWSWFDGTPKGVSIHYVDSGIDTGPILAQSEVVFGDPQKETLATTYQKLLARAAVLLRENWEAIRENSIVAKQQHGGSFHTSKEKEQWWSFLPDGYDTPVAYVAELGAKRPTLVERRQSL